MRGFFSILCFALLLCSVAQGAVIIYTTNMSGPAESPPNSSPGFGTSVVTYDNVAHTLAVSAVFADLLPTTAAGAPSATTAAHIHCCTLPTAGVATQTPSFSGFPLNVRAGSFNNTFDLTAASSWNAAFITANGGTPATAEAALAAGLNNGVAYFNIHTNAFPGGEIRGFLTAVPEPSTGLLLLLPAAAFWAVRRRSHRL